MNRLVVLIAGLLSVAGCGGNNHPARGDVTLAPPADGQGWQLEVPHFDVASGTETQACYFFAVPGTPGAPVWVNHIVVAQNPGTHHMNLFRVKTVTGLGGVPGQVVVDGPCFGPSSNWADWPLVVNSQDDQQVDWQLPDGVGERFSGGELLMLQTHFVNATTQKTPLGGRVLVNLYTPPAPPANELGTLFATNQHIRICPGDTNKTFEAHCTFSSQGVHVIAANGHFHSRGRDFTISTVDETGNVAASPFYESIRWDDPPMARGLDVMVPPNGGVDWKCSFDYACPDGAAICGNPMDMNCFTFGGHVDTQEHCNAFVYYWPKTQDIGCF